MNGFPDQIFQICRPGMPGIIRIPLCVTLQMLIAFNVSESELPVVVAGVVIMHYLLAFVQF
jgi:hypothetical protein